jgi:hypothetical protein
MSTASDLPGGSLRRVAVIDFAKAYGEDADFVDASDPEATVVTSVGAAESATIDASEFAAQEDLDAAGNVTYLHPRSIHYPVIDIDLPCHWVESSTSGHGHLYIDHPMPWVRFLALLEALAIAGVVEEGYVAACRREGFASVRLPWVKKVDQQVVPQPVPEATLEDLGL